MIDGSGPLTPEEGKRLLFGILTELAKLNANIQQLNHLMAADMAAGGDAGPPVGVADVAEGLGALLSGLGVSVEPPKGRRRR